MPQPVRLPVALNRIAIGVAFGAIVIAILFSAWGLTVDRGGPLIGVLVFEFFALTAIMFLGANVLLKKIEI